MNPLNPSEKRIVLGKGIELPFTGELLTEKRAGVFVCHQCDAPTAKGREDRFDAHCVNST